MKKILDIQNLSFIKDKEILKSISWQVEKGERWALLGANGAGKTSLLSVICGYEVPSSGIMTVDGKTYSECEWQRVREKIAIVSANINRKILTSETALEIVVSGEFAMINFWGTADEKVCQKAVRKMKELGVFHLAASRWSQLSQGERQKVQIARSLMVNPTVMFLDEPCTGLDPVARDNFVGFMEKISESKKIPAIVLATHYVEEIPPSFTNAMVIRDGEVLASGKIGDVVTSSVLSEAYGADCKVSRRNGRFSLKIS